ncbi:MAG: hypothetical protein D6729_15345, partial [Deltaproteobacteria bacterium]
MSAYLALRPETAVDPAALAAAGGRRVGPGLYAFEAREAALAAASGLFAERRSLRAGVAATAEVAARLAEAAAAGEGLLADRSPELPEWEGPRIAGAVAVGRFHPPPALEAERMRQRVADAAAT